MKKVKSTTVKKMYHLSPIRNKQSILENGLQSENGEIFFFTKLEQAKHIACNQVGIEKYSIFEIDLAGIKGKLHNDNSGEFGSAYQFYAKQKHVDAKFVKHFLDVESNVYDQAEECELPKYRILAKLYGARGKKQIDAVALAMLEELVSFNQKWIEHYNRKYNKSLKFVDLNSLKAA